MPVVSFEAFETAFRAAFVAFWASRTPVAFENDGFDPDTEFDVDPGDPAASDVDAWVRLTLDPIADRTVNPSINAYGTFRRDALAIFSIYVRDGQGVAESNAHVDEIVRFFRRPALIPNAVVSNIAPATIGPNGVWFQRTVSVDLGWFTDQPATP